MIKTTIISYFLWVSLLAVSSQAFTAARRPHNRRSSSRLFYTEEKVVTKTDSLPAKQIIKTTKFIKGKKPTIFKIFSLDELQTFLEEDDERLTVIKFYAPWCKSCKRLGPHFDRLANELGDGVYKHKKVEGKVRFAAIEYDSRQAARFIQDQLQVMAVPSLQIYKGLSKVWQMAGPTHVRDVRRELNRLDNMSLQELEAHALAVDDGILQEAIEDSFFDVSEYDVYDYEC